MLPPTDVLKDVAADVLFVQALHHRDHDIAFWVIEPCGPRHVEPLEGAFTNSVGLRLKGTVRVV